MTLYPDDTEQSSTIDIVVLKDIVKIGVSELSSSCGRQN